MGILLSIFLGVIPAFSYALFVYWLDRYEKEPKLLLGGVFVWGAVVAAGAAFVINTVLGIGIYIFTQSATATDLATGSIIAPIVEETLKGLAVLVVFLLFYKEFDSILDGIVYAGITALGFAATENSFYIYSFGYQEAGYGGLLFLAFIRNILVGWQHPFYTAFIGIGLAIARLNRNLAIRLAAPVLGWGLAVFTHAVHNTMSSFLSGLGGWVFGTLVDWTGWLFMFGVIVWAIYRERGYVVDYLREEAEKGVISPAQYRTACSAWGMSMARMNALFDGRYQATNQFYHLCAELSHKKHHLHVLGDERGNNALVQKIRGEMARLAPRAGA